MKKSSTNKSSLRKLVLASLAAGPVALVPTLHAAPIGLPDTASTNLTAPSGVTTTLTTGAQNTLTIRVNGTSASNTILSWVDFGGANAIGADGNDSLVFTLPTADSAVLNKVTGTSATTIGNGASVSSNGKVFVLNPNGVTISGNAQINAAAFVASAIADTDTDSYFTANGDLHMNGGSSGNVTVSGTAAVNVGSGNVVLAGSVMNVAGTITGNLSVKTVWTGGTINLASGTALNVTGNVTLASSGSNIELAKDANTTITSGDLSINSTGTLATGTVSTTKNANLDSGKTVTVNAGTKAVGLQGDIRNLSVTAAGDVTLTATNAVSSLGVTSAGALTVTAANDLTLGAASLTGNLSLTSTTGSIKSSGSTTLASGKTVTLSAVTAGKSATFAGSGAITVASAMAPTVTITSTGNIDASAAGLANGVGGQNLTALSITSSGGTVKTGVVDATVGGSVTLSGNAGVTTGTLQAKTISVTAAAGGATLGTVTLDGATTNAGSLTISTHDSIVLPSITQAPAISVTSTAGDITQGANTITDVGGGNAVATTVDAMNAITLTNANELGQLVVKNHTSSKAVSVTDNSGGLIVKDGSNAMGDTTLTATAGDITLGAAAADTLTFGNVTLAASAGNIAATAKNITTGTLTLSATGNVTLNAASQAYNFGTLKTGVGIGGNLTVSEASALDLGALTVGGTLTASSATGITSSGVVNVTGTSSFDLTAAGDIMLNTANKLGGAVTLGAGGKVANATIKNDAALVVAGAKVTGDLTLATNATAENISQTGAITVPGTLTVTTTGNSATDLSNVANALVNVTLATAGSGTVAIDDASGGVSVAGSTSGALTVTEVGAGAITYGATSVNKAVTLATQGAGDITINGSITGAGAQNLNATTANGAIHLGSFYSESGGLVANTTATAAMGIDDVDGARANIYGDVDFETKGGAIAITNWSDIKTSTTVAHRFGGITANTVNGSANGAAVTIYEGGTERIKSITAGKGDILLQASSDNTEFSSNPSDIVSSTVGQGNTTLTTTGNVTLYARNSVKLDTAGQTVTVGGNLFGVANTDASLATSVVTLGNAGGTQVGVTGVIDAIASGNVTISTSGAAKLGGGNLVTGDFYAGGNLNVLAAGNITQDTALLRAKGSVTLNAGANNITLATSTNEFGGVDVTGTTVVLKENGTTRLVNANVTDLSVTSTGDIIGKDDNTETIVSTGTATFNPGGNLTLKGNNQFATVMITATGATQNVEIKDTTGNTTIKGGSSIGGNLTVTNSAALGTITQDNTINGAGLTVNGTLAVTSSATGGILVSNPNNMFGKVRFSGGSGNVDIEQNNSMVVVPGSTTVTAGTVTLRSINGTLSNDTTGTGSNSFAGNVTLQAMQNVSVLNEWFVAGTLTITTSSGMVVDLSGLSKAVDLHGVAPVVNGGTLKAGTPNP